MRWTLVLVFALSFSAPSWAQDLELHLPGWFQVDPAVLSPTPGDIAKRLLSLSTELLREVDGLTLSLEESRSALLNCQGSLDEANRLLIARSRELWLWRGATALSVAGLAGALVWGLSR